jgi:hypothetical protein
MNEQDIDRRLAALLVRPDPEPDPAFVDRLVLAARFDRQVAAARRRNLRRALIDCGAAVAVGVSFFLMSQMSGAVADGIIVPGGPAMAGLVMLVLWGAIALPVANGRGDLGLAA